MKRRPLRDRLIEAFIRKSRNDDLKTEEEYRSYLLSLGENDKINEPEGKLGYSKSEFQGIPVFTCNDLKDPGQKVILYFHGGGYVANPDSSHYGFLHDITKATGMKGLLPVYKKAPMHNYREAYQVLTDYYRLLLEVTPSRDIIFMGDSAGGGLALGMAQALRDQGLDLPGKLILISPWVDLNTDNPEIKGLRDKDPMLVDWWLRISAEYWASGKENLNDPMVSPAFGDCSGLSDIIITCGTRELLYPDIVKFSHDLKAKGIDHTFILGEGQNHVYPIYGVQTNEAKKARKLFVDALKQI